MSSVLVYVPLNPQTPRVYARALTSVLRMAYPDFDLVLDKEDAPAGPARPKREKYQNVLAKYEFARRLALAMDYEVLLTVEADVIVPPDTLERLLAVDADVAYGLYCSRYGRHQWLAYTMLAADRGRSLSDDHELARAVWGQVFPTVGVGMGCTLIHRRVLEAVPFRLDPGSDMLANDWYFALDLQEKGFRQAHDLGVVCGHVCGPPSAKIVWPDPAAPWGYRYEFFDVPVTPLEGPLTVHVTGLEQPQEIYRVVPRGVE